MTVPGTKGGRGGRERFTDFGVGDRGLERDEEGDDEAGNDEDQERGNERGRQ
jgi:hypothetical protein